MLPRVIVFDLDGTLWSPEMHHLGSGGAPFTAHQRSGDTMLDHTGRAVELIGETRTLLNTLINDPKWSSTYLAVSSTCEVPHWAKELLQRFQFVNKEGKQVPMGSLFGDRVEMFKADKAEHHRRILAKVHALDPTVHSFSQMLFFDNKANNIRDASRIGVATCLCPQGMVPGTFERGLQTWRRAQQSKL